MDSKYAMSFFLFFLFPSRRRHTRYWRDWSSDLFSSDLAQDARLERQGPRRRRVRSLDILRAPSARARGDRGLEDQVYRPEPAAEVSRGRVREAGPVRPLPRLDRAAPGGPARGRGALPGDEEDRADRREYRIPADKRDQGRSRQEARQAR